MLRADIVFAYKCWVVKFAFAAPVADINAASANKYLFFIFLSLGSPDDFLFIFYYSIFSYFFETKNHVIGIGWQNQFFIV